jgi:hypothetical protein
MSVPRIFWAVAAVALLGRSTPQTGKQNAEYEAWIRAYRTPPLRAGLRNPEEKVEARLVVSTMKDDRTEAPSQFMGYPGEGFTSRHGCSLYVDGQVWRWSVDLMGAKGGGYYAPPPPDRARLDDLLNHLPGDLSRVPPPNRKLFIQVQSGGTITARLYDRANLPESILEILRLTRCRAVQDADSAPHR